PQSDTPPDFQSDSGPRFFEVRIHQDGIHGSLVITPGGVGTCGADCSLYLSGTHLVVTATPDPGYQASPAGLDFIVTAPFEITIHFTGGGYLLAVDLGTAGGDPVRR